MILEHSKKPAKPIFAYLGAVFYVVMLVCAIIGIKTSNILFGIPILVMIIILFTWSRMFDWYLFAKIFEEKNQLIYEVTEIVDVVGHDTTRYEVDKIDKIKQKGKDVTIYGHIHVLEGLRKNKNKYVKSLKIFNCNDEAIALINKYK